MYAIMDNQVLGVFRKQGNQWFFWVWIEHFHGLFINDVLVEDSQWLPIVDKQLEEIVSKLPPVSATEVLEFVFNHSNEQDEWMNQKVKDEILEGITDA